MIKVILAFIAIFAVLYVLTVLYFDAALSYGDKNRLPAALKIEEVSNSLNSWVNEALNGFPKK